VTVKIILSCDGCHTETGPHRLPHREFHGVTGKSHGFGVWKEPELDDAVPAGWVRSDPYTGCPTCWAEIVTVAA
jgi:hypothetical protein